MNTLQIIFSFFFKLNHRLPQIGIPSSTTPFFSQTTEEIFKTLLNSTPPAYPNFFKKFILSQNLAAIRKVSAINPLLVKKDQVSSLNLLKEKILKNAYLIALFLKNSSERDTAFCCISKVQASINICNARKVASIIECQKKKDEALVRIVESLVLTDLEEAKKIALTIKNLEYKDLALLAIVKVLVLKDLEEAEKTALTIKNWEHKNLALFAVVTAHATIDLEKASAVARQMSFIYQANAKSYVLFKMVQADVYNDLDQALLILETIEDSQDTYTYKTKTVLEIIKRLIPDNLDKALSLAQAMKSVYYRDKALYKVVKHLIPFNLKEAFRIASLLKNDDLKNKSFFKIIKELLPTDLKQAILFIAQMKSDNENGVYYKNLALVELVKAHALINPDFAFLTIQMINETLYPTQDPEYPFVNYKGVAFIEIIKVLASTNPEQALSKLEWIENNMINLKSFYKNQALLEIIQSFALTNLEAASGLISQLDPDASVNYQMIVYVKIINQLSINHLEKALELAKSKLQDKQNLPIKGSHSHTYYQSFALFKLVTKYIAVDLTKAKTIAYEIKEPNYRERALVKIAQAEAAIYWEKGLHTTLHIENQTYKIQALEKLAETTSFVSLKVTEQAFNLLTNSNMISHPYHVVCNLTEIVNELNKTGDILHSPCTNIR